MVDELGKKIGQEVMRQTERDWIEAARDRDLVPSDVLDWMRDTLAYREPIMSKKGLKRVDTPAAKNVQHKAAHMTATMFGMLVERREVSGGLRVVHDLEDGEIRKLIDEVIAADDESRSSSPLPQDTQAGKRGRKRTRGGS